MPYDQYGYNSGGMLPPLRSTKRPTQVPGVGMGWGEHVNPPVPEMPMPFLKPPMEKGYGFEDPVATMGGIGGGGYGGGLGNATGIPNYGGGRIGGWNPQPPIVSPGGPIGNPKAPRRPPSLDLGVWRPR